MDITIETAVVALVALVAAVAALAIATGQADDFTSFANNQQEAASKNCELLLLQGKAEEADNNDCDVKLCGPEGGFEPSVSSLGGEPGCCSQEGGSTTCEPV